MSVQLNHASMKEYYRYVYIPVSLVMTAICAAVIM